MKKWLLISWILSCLTAEAQYIPVRKFTVEDGLANANVFRIYQDRKGFLWFATDYGLSCYDGQTFLNYTSSQGLSHNSMMSVTETADEQMLICTYGGGINILCNGKVRPVKYTNIPRKVLYTLPFRQGLLVLDHSGYLLWCHDTLSKKISAEVRYMIPFGKNAVLLATMHGLQLMDSCGMRTFCKAIREPVDALSCSAAGDIAAACGSKVFLISGQKIRVHTLPVAGGISDLLIDRHKNVWEAARGEIFLTDSNGNTTRLADKLRLKGIVINDMFEDRSGNTWLATHGSGLYCIRSMNVINYPVQEGLLNNYVRSITQVNDRMYFTSIGTISAAGKGILQRIPSRSLSENGFSDHLYFISRQGNKLLVGTNKNIIVKTPDNMEAEEVIPCEGALAICTDRNGTTWIGGYSGLHILRGDHLYEPGFRIPVPFSRVNCIVPDPSGSLFIGTGTGLFRFDGHRFFRIATGRGIALNTINSLYLDRWSRLWVATDAGLCMRQNDATVIYNTSNGLSHNKCTGVTGDREGNVWVGTFGGLHQFNRNRLIKYDTESGLISNEVLSLCADSAGNVWAGTANGISCIRPGDLIDEKEAPAVYITAAMPGDSSFHFPSSVTLPAGTKRLRIEYAAIVFPRADKTEFGYMLQGSDHEWQHTTGHAIEFSALPAGDHTFLLRARKNGGVWSKPVSLFITVQVPFWERSWFMLQLFCTCTCITYLLIRRSIHRKEAKKKEKAAIKDRMLRLEHQALNASINPHFVFNCLNAIQAYIHKNDREAAKDYLVRFSRLIRNILEHGRDTYITLAGELERIELYLYMEKLRFGDKLSYKITAGPGLNAHLADIPNMILQPYIENAILHGIMPKRTGGTVHVSITRTGDQLTVQVEDDGVGIHAGSKPVSDAHRSMGMQITEQRLSLLQAIEQQAYTVTVTEKKDASGQACGTLVRITMPIRVVAVNQAV